MWVDGLGLRVQDVYARYRRGQFSSPGHAL